MASLGNLNWCTSQGFLAPAKPTKSKHRKVRRPLFHSHVKNKLARTMLKLSLQLQSIGKNLHWAPNRHVCRNPPVSILLKAFSCLQEHGIKLRVPASTNTEGSSFTHGLTLTKTMLIPLSSHHIAYFKRVSGKSTRLKVCEISVGCRLYATELGLSTHP